MVQRKLVFRAEPRHGLSQFQSALERAPPGWLGLLGLSEPLASACLLSIYLLRCIAGRLGRRRSLSIDVTAAAAGSHQDSARREGVG